MMKRTPVIAVASASLFLLLAGPALADGDAVKGEKVWNRCKTCHTLEPGAKKIGPHLAGLFGRKAGAVEDFKYSDAMREAGVIWDEKTLDGFLANPKEFIKGNKMSFPGLKKENQRADLIAFLKVNAGK